MAKKKNSGFSLIEIVIAVAILGLLITPILTQIVHTSNTSRKAKERQAAVENAEYITNFIQSVDKSELDKASSGGLSDISINSKTDFTVSCKLVDKNGNELTNVTYKATVYDLDNVKLGPKSNEYTRKAILDDLNSTVMAAGYEILYDSSQYTDTLKNKGFTLTNEGSIVMYNESIGGTVSQVVCVPRDAAFTDEGSIYKYKNPNSVSLGFIQDLDSSKVAIIQGVASNFDAQAADDIFAQKMNNLRFVNEAKWKDQFDRDDHSNLFANDETGVRLLYVSIKSHKDTEGNIEYYEVLCDVCYYENYSIAGATSDFTAKLKYNVFSKKFYTTESPDIYLIYEPYVMNFDKKMYAYNDYIEIYNDEDTADSKLYLIKPSSGQLAGTDYVDGYHYTADNGGDIKPVNINITAAIENGESTSTKKLLKIFTNIEINYTVGGWTQFSFDNTIRGSAYSSDDDITTEQLRQLRKMPWPSYITNAKAYPSAYLMSLDKDTNNVDRLYTVTVILKSVDGKMDDARYTAGKGVN